MKITEITIVIETERASALPSRALPYSVSINEDAGRIVTKVNGALSIDQAGQDESNVAWEVAREIRDLVLKTLDKVIVKDCHFAPGMRDA